MIDYYETKAHPITRRMVLDAYVEIKNNGKAAGIDGVSLSDYAEGLEANLYKLWNRLTSGSYFPQLTREKNIPKKGGGTRSLGIATVEDRIAQQVVRAHIEPGMEATFHADSYGYRPGRHAHQAIKAATSRCFTHNWVLDIDIKSYFDTIDHDLLLKAVKKYTEERWVLLYIERWLKAGTLKEDGSIADRTEGTAQGSVLSPLLSNVFLHFVFDKWMEKRYATIKFERYSDDIIVHCKSEKQAVFLKGIITQRFTDCKLTLSETKTKVVCCKNPNNKGERKHEHESFDFLGFTYKPRLIKTQKGILLLSMPAMSRKAKKSVLDKIRLMKLHKQKWKLAQVAGAVNEKVNGWFNKSKDCLWRANGYGDWYAPGPATDIDFIDECFFAYSTELLIKVAGILRQTSDVQQYSDLLRKIKLVFWAAYKNLPETQTAYVLALQFDLLPDSARKKAAAHLVELIQASHDHLSTGFLGTPYLLPVLSRFGYTGLAFTLLDQTTPPSWLYPITKGATTVWEKWEAVKPDGSLDTCYGGSTCSFNHYAYGAVGDWLYEVVAGIRPLEPGYRKILIAPHPGGGLSWVKAGYRCRFGVIRSDWRIRGRRIVLTVDIPEGTRATIEVPAGQGHERREVGPGHYRLTGYLRTAHHNEVIATIYSLDEVSQK